MVQKMIWILIKNKNKIFLLKFKFFSLKLIENNKLKILIYKFLGKKNFFINYFLNLD